jgi:flagellar motor protein MotB
VGKRLLRIGHSVQVEGHSDASPNITPEANWQLSMNRGLNVVQFLVRADKFPPPKISLAELVVPVDDENKEAYSWDSVDP